MRIAGSDVLWLRKSTSAFKLQSTWLNVFLLEAFSVRDRRRLFKLTRFIVQLNWLFVFAKVYNL